VESCYAWEYVYDLCTELGISAHVVDTGKMGRVTEKKNDIEDARRMIKRYRAGELPEIKVLPPGLRQLRDLLRYRIFITRKISGVRCHAHFVVDRCGFHPTRSALFGERATDPAKWPLDRSSQVQLDSMRRVLDVLEAQETAIEGEVVRQLLNVDEVRRLLTIPGVGPILAAVIYLEIGQIGRFADKEKLTAYAGLVPRIAESDAALRMGRVRTRCNHYLKWAAIEAARHGVKNDPALKKRYMRLLGAPENAATTVRKSKAVVAVARFLLEVVWCMLVRGEDYRVEQRGVPHAKWKDVRQRAKSYQMSTPASLLEGARKTLDADAGMYASQI